jgi:hypothetical protein
VILTIHEKIERRLHLPQPVRSKKFAPLALPLGLKPVACVMPCYGLVPHIFRPAAKEYHREVRASCDEKPETRRGAGG